MHYNFSADTVPANDINESISVLKTHPLFGLGANTTGYSGNMMLDITVALGLVGLVLLTVLVILMTLKSIKSVSASTMKSDKIRFLSIGLLCSQLSFVLICLFSDICCDINVIFMFSVIMSLSYVSGKCYEADFIDETVVREYK